MTTFVTVSNESRAPFHEDFTIVFQIRWKFYRYDIFILARQQCCRGMYIIL